MKKKVFVIIIATVMILSLAACSNSGGGGAATPPPSGGSSSSGSGSSSSGSGSSSGGEVKLPSYTWDVGTMFIDPANNPNFNAEGMALARFRELLEEKSGGALKVNVHWASVLGNMDDLFDMLRTNDLAIAYSTGASSGDKRYGVFNMPGLITSYDMAHDLMGTLDADLMQVYKRITEENNVKNLSGTVGTLRQVYNSKKQVKVPADMAGLMIRIYNDNTVATYWNGLCGTAVLPMPELYTSLQLGTVDAFEHGPFSAISNSLTDVVSHCTVISWQWQTMPSFMMSMDLYKKLEPEVIAVLEATAYEAQEYYYELMNVDTSAAYDFMRDKGIEVYYPTAAEQKLWDVYGLSIYPKLEAAYGADLVNEVTGIVNAYKAKH